MYISLNFTQEDCPCCTEYHQQFDFWVGEWNVYNVEGIQVGENQILKLEDGTVY